MTILKPVTPIVIVLLACIIQSGCSTLDTASRSAPIGANPADASGMYAVNVFPSFGGKEVSFKGQIRGNMTVQNALEESGAVKTARSSEIQLYRVVKGSGRTLKLPVELQSNGRTVKFEHDYALHPGDRLVVRGTTGSGVVKILEQIISPGSQ